MATDKTLLWMPYSDVSKIVIGLFLGIAGTYTASWLMTKSPSLTYDAGAYTTFSGDKNKYGIFSIIIENEGNKFAEDVTCTVQLDTATIQEVTITPNHIPATKDYKGTDLTASFKTLNAGERIQITLLTSNPEKSPSFKLFSVRGKDAVGTPRSTNKGMTFTGTLYVVFFMGCVIFTGWVLTGWLIEYQFKKRNEAEIARINAAGKAREIELAHAK